jgi:hypothetical protein
MSHELITRLNAIEFTLFVKQSERLDKLESQLDTLNNDIAHINERRHFFEQEVEAAFAARNDPDGDPHEGRIDTDGWRYNDNNDGKWTWSEPKPVYFLPRYVPGPGTQTDRPDYDYYNEISDPYADEMWLTVTTKSHKEVYLEWMEMSKNHDERVDALSNKLYAASLVIEKLEARLRNYEPKE